MLKACGIIFVFLGKMITISTFIRVCVATYCRKVHFVVPRTDGML